MYGPQRCGLINRAIDVCVRCGLFVRLAGTLVGVAVIHSYLRARVIPTTLFTCSYGIE